MTILELISKYNAASTGIFKAGQSRGIGSDDMRTFVTDITMLEDIPLTLFWPLSGTADLTSDVDIEDDGTHHIAMGTLLFPLDTFEVNATGDIDLRSEFASINLGNLSETYVSIAQVGATIHAHADNGVNHSHLFVDADTGVDLDTDTDILLTADDGVDSSTISLTPSILNIDVIDEASIIATSGSDISTIFAGLIGADPHVQTSIYDGTNSSQVDISPSGISLEASDGSNTSQVNLLPTGLQLSSFTVAGAPSASPAGKIAYCSDESGGAIVVFSDNSGNWRRVTDGSIIS